MLIALIVFSILLLITAVFDEGQVKPVRLLVSVPLGIGIAVGFALLMIAVDGRDGARLAYREFREWLREIPMMARELFGRQ